MDESGIISAYNTDPAASGVWLSYQDYSMYEQPMSAVSTPSSQTDFNTGGDWDVKGVLGGVAQTISAVGGAVIGYENAKSTGQVNSAIANAANARTLQQLSTQGTLADLQAKTVLAQAQAAYNKAAGIIPGSSSTLVVIIAIAGLALAAMQLHEKG